MLANMGVVPVVYNWCPALEPTSSCPFKGVQFLIYGILGSSTTIEAFLSFTRGQFLPFQHSLSSVG